MFNEYLLHVVLLVCSVHHPEVISVTVNETQLRKELSTASSSNRPAVPDRNHCNNTSLGNRTATISYHHHQQQQQLLLRQEQQREEGSVGVVTKTTTTTATMEAAAHKLSTVVAFQGYANNPFGPSKRKHIHQNSTKFNNTKQPLFPAAESLRSFITGTNLVDIGKNYLGVGEEDFQEEPRYKRGVVHLYNMVSCATGCNPLIYKGYGCYCGFLGSGYAVDGIDRCCKFHDWCYDTANCPMYLEYFIPYYWKCRHRRPICAVEHGEWGGAGSCAQRLCECDRVLSECLRRFPCPSTRAICTSSPWRLLQNAFMIL